MISFRAHKQQTPQTSFTANAYSLVTFPNESNDGYYNSPGYDNGSRFSSSAWVPVAANEDPRMVQFSGQLWLTNGVIGPGGGPFYVARIVKNGYPSGVSIGAKIGTKGPFTGDWVIDLGMQDVANAGDSYSVYLFTTHSDIVVDGISLHTWWSGCVF